MSTVSGGDSFEFSSVAVDDPNKPQAVIIHLKRSKTDPFRSGVSIYLTQTFKDLYPVEALLAYLHIRGKAPGPLFWLEDGNPLRKSKFISLVRLALASQGMVDKGYSALGLGQLRQQQCRESLTVTSSYWVAGRVQLFSIT